ncbi:hypothetical protein LMC02_09985 [Limosilactobacillus reuteri]|uniref:hypothetical protein n=1 Tax=Limosilactobacillus reuteri TaxID=1598 RepID=UPI001E28B20D|nr:hypothetical protein [Limosilactobacillus reuteri]MCC4500317.1 hypothetical protein [Limosilactobacillus reuteri]MCC4500642.1 hypothetical protein [Limosilactobacillus reuteri]
MKYCESKTMEVVIATVAELKAGLIKQSRLDDSWDMGLENPEAVALSLEVLSSSKSELIMAIATVNGMSLDLTFQTATKELANFLIKLPAEDTPPEVAGWLQQQLPSLPDDDSEKGLFLEADINPVAHCFLPERLGLKEK